jgi:hypothetical protein
MLVHQFTSTPKVLDIRTKDPRNFSVMGQVFPVKLMKHQLDRSINWNQTDIIFQLVQDLSVGFHSKVAVGNLDQGNLVLGAEGDDQLLIGLLLALLVEDTHVGLAAVQGLGSLTETTGKTVVHQSQLQDTLEGIENGHLSLGSLGGNLNLIGGDLGGVVFYVRHLGGFSRRAILEDFLEM